MDNHGKSQSLELSYSAVELSKSYFVVVMTVFLWSCCFAPVRGIWILLISGIINWRY